MQMGSTEGIVSLGPWGNLSGGEPWIYKPTSGISEIIIHEGGIIKSISFKDADGFISGTFGGSCPNASDRGQETKIVVNWPSEYLKSISGMYGNCNGVSDVIISLSFNTNIKTHGPFGTTTSGEPFTIPIADSVVVGFHGRSGDYLHALGVYVKPGNLEGSISFGEWGGPGGEPFQFTVESTWIKEITIHHGSNHIKSLSFKDGNGKECGSFGGSNRNDTSGGKKIIEFLGQCQELLTSISGTYGRYSGTSAITSLSFITNRETYGPYGKKEGTAFSLPIKGGIVAGFHGKAGHFIDSIGIYVKPWSTEGVISLGPWGNPSGGDTWCFKTPFGISEIIIHEGGNIKSISFKDSGGFTSETFGGNAPNASDRGGDRRTVVVQWPSEYLKSISGTYGDYNEVPGVIISLSFITNLTTYGPFGNTTMGKPFSIPTADSAVVGFHGRSGYYLDALGVYVKPWSTEGVISLGPWGSGSGGEPWSYKTSFDISEIIIHEGGNIKSISFKDSGGFISKTFGGKNPNASDGDKETKIAVKCPSEYLQCISGKYGDYNGLSNVIISLSITTNLTTHGPFGTADDMGEPFSIPIADSVVVGFHGRCGYYLDALGVYVKPRKAD